MENLPKNVINKIMLYLSTPTADIVKNSFIFEFMALRLAKHGRGSPFDCGIVDTTMNHRYYRPREFSITPHGQRSTKLTLEDAEHDEYTAAFLHYSRGQNIGPPDIYPTWRIKGNRFKWNPQEHPSNSDPESGTASYTDSRFEPDSDTDSDSTAISLDSNGDRTGHWSDHEMT